MFFVFEVAFVFSNRLFFSKAVALWTGKDDLEHVYTVGSYVHYGAGGATPQPSPHLGSNCEAACGDARALVSAGAACRQGRD